MTDLSEEIIEKYQWIPNVSITFMEFLHGAIRTKNKNACFFLRSKESLIGIPNLFENKFYESSELSKTQLNRLKEKLKSAYPNQVFEYSTNYLGIDNSTGREKV
jgi:hypothetical protein